MSMNDAKDQLDAGGGAASGGNPDSPRSVLNIIRQSRDGFHHVSTGSTLHAIKVQYINLNFFCHYTILRYTSFYQDSGYLA